MNKLVKKGKQKNNGITLIALVITIIVLLILAGVTIATLTGENRVLTKAQTAKENTVETTEKEQLKLALSEVNMKEYIPSDNEDEEYDWLQTELDNIVGKDKTYIVSIMCGYDFEIYEVTFSDTGNYYYVRVEFDTESYTLKNPNIITEEEYVEIAKEESTEDLETLTTEQQEKINKGFKADINSENGFISILTEDREAIVDWGDGTYSKVKDVSYGSLGKIASINSNISVSAASRIYPIWHQYSEKNKTYKIKIYASSINMSESTALQKITDWGENQMVYVSFHQCTNLTDIVSLGSNSYISDSFNGVFIGCTSLKQIPQDFFDNCSSITNVSYAFSGCTSLTGNAIPLWEKDITGEKCYEGCTNLANYEDIPEEWK